jgi:hypothetical protein
VPSGLFKGLSRVVRHALRCNYRDPIEAIDLSIIIFRAGDVEQEPIVAGAE